MTDAQLHRDIGQLQAQVRALEQVTQQQNRLLAEIRTTLSEARGGWRVLMWLGGAAGAIGAAIGGFITWLAKSS